MAGRKKPVLRLTIFFILVVLVSGSILAYLSINNISNLKELTEKRVQEEQLKLIHDLGAQLDDQIVSVAEWFSDQWKYKTYHQTGHMALPDTLEMVEEVFVIDRHGNFLLPWYIDAFTNQAAQAPTKNFQRNFDQAERAEFYETDFKKANSFYLSSLGASSSKFDSAQSLNALARLAVKMDDAPRAFNYYSSITANYQGLGDMNNFPYVYYAIPQLIRITNTSNRIQVEKEIHQCLRGIARGQIPMNQSTLALLSQISQWIEGEPTSNSFAPRIQDYIEIVRKRMAFLERNRGIIREHLLRDSKLDPPIFPGGYNILNSTSDNEGELLLLRSEGELVSGFSILIEQIWEKIRANDNNAHTVFEYEIDLYEPDKEMKSMDHPLVTSMVISPYFPGYTAGVRLKNEDLINEFVKRRSWIYGIALSLLLGGMLLGILLILRDISREEHLASLRADFISNVTHELKTPLTSIQLFTESMALKRIKSETQKQEYLQIILKETSSLQRMINNILDFSIKERGRKEYNFEQINISELVNAAINDLDYWLVEKNFTLHREIEANVTVRADSSALKQAIINLLNNAIKFSIDQKEISVRLTEVKEHIQIQVEDKGIGIPENQQELIFQPFYRVGQNGSEEISGTGLGLSVVKEIVEAHQGITKVESKLNQGSTFTILIKASQEN